MKRKFFAMFYALLLSVFLMFPALAAGDLPRLVDEADLVSDDEEMELMNLLNEVSERHQVDLVVVTVDSLEGMSPMAYADDFYDYYEYGFGDERDGILFLISMEERDWYISTCGYGITAITDAGLEYMSEALIENLSEGDYTGAFTAFAELCDDYIEQARTGEPYDEDHLPKEPFGVFWNLGISMGIGLLVSWIITGFMKGELKTVHSQSVANQYVIGGSMNLTKEKDLFLYSRVERREKPKETKSSDSDRSGNSSSTHTSSSGTVHGGGGGKF